MADVQMPQLGETVTEGTITRWFKQIGDSVTADEPLFEVSTDKVDSEVPSPIGGTLSEILVSEGDTVEVGAVLARIGEEGGGPSPEAETGADDAGADSGESENGESEAGQAQQAEPESGEANTGKRDTSAPRAHVSDSAAARPTAEADEDPPARPAAEPPTSGDRRLLSPVVRKLVNENDLDVDALTGTGPGGRITRDDVLDAIDAGTARRDRPPTQTQPTPAPARSSSGSPDSGRAPTPAPAPRAGERDTAVPHSRIRRATAEHMRRSLDTAAHVYATIEVDFDNVDRVRLANKDEFKSDEGFSLTYLPFISRAVVAAIADFPHVNASFGEDELIVHHEVHLGIAVDLDFQGLLVPVIAGADGLRLRAIGRAVSDLAGRARSKKLGPDELAGGTFTITNPGPFGTTMTLAVINQPQVAILATDAVKRRPVVVELPDGSEAIAIHPTGFLTLTWDHRAFDGAYAAAFLKRLKDTLETRDWAAELG